MPAHHHVAHRANPGLLEPGLRQPRPRQPGFEQPGHEQPGHEQQRRPTALTRAAACDRALDAVTRAAAERGGRTASAETRPLPEVQPKLGTLVYARRPDGSVLLVERRRPPFVGHWVAPGGEVEPHEAPHAGASREFHEETGLNVLDLSLRGIVREVSPRQDFQWLLFLYRCCACGGQPTPGDAGDVRWWTREELERAPVPEADRWWLPQVLREGSDVFEATLHYDASLALTRIENGGR